MPGQLLRLDTEIYGTDRGPSWWRETFTGAIKELGYRESPLDPCAYILTDTEVEVSRRKKLLDRLHCRLLANGEGEYLEARPVEKSDGWTSRFYSHQRARYRRGR